MTTRKKPVLGRNLSSMLSQTALKHVQEHARTGGELRHLPLDVIRPGRYQPRSLCDQDRLEELASSIRAQGVVQPIVVRPVDDDQFEIIAGERRWRASQMAGAASRLIFVSPLTLPHAFGMRAPPSPTRGEGFFRHRSWQI